MENDFDLNLVWVTNDGREIPVRLLERGHAWNILGFLERRGCKDTAMYDEIRRHLGTVTVRERIRFGLRNFWYQINHPGFRRF